MSETLKVAIPAVIALIGTIITASLAYRQWKRQQQAARSSSFLVDKQTAYKNLWDNIEKVHIKLRTEEVYQSQFNTLLTDVNAFILSNALYLEEHDRRLVNQYLQGLFRFVEIIRSSGDEEAKEALRTTAIIPRSTIEKVNELKALSEELDLVRNSLIQHCRKEMGGDMT